MGNTRNTGYLQNIVQYDASNNITLPANLTVTGSIVGYATTSYVTTQINNLINGAPGALDTLNELAAALGNDASFAATLTTSLSGKQASLSGTGFVKSTAGTISYDTSTYLTTASATSTYLPLAGGTLTGNLYLLNANTRISSDGNGEVGLNYGTTTTSTYTFSLYNNITRTVGFTASGSAVFSSTISSTRINFPSNAYAYISEEYGLRLNMGGDTSTYGVHYYNQTGTKVVKIDATGAGIFNSTLQATSIGIGNTPSYLLDVYAATSATTSTMFRLKNGYNDPSTGIRMRWDFSSLPGVYLDVITDSGGSKSMYLSLSSANAAPTQVFQIVGSTGAATFSNSITSAGLNLNSGGVININTQNGFQLGADSASGGFYVYDNTNATYRLKIANGGAATFTSNLSVNGNLILGSYVSSNITLNTDNKIIVRQASMTLDAVTPSWFGYSTGYAIVKLGSTDTNRSLAFNVDVTGNPSGAFSGLGSEYVWRNAGSFITPNASNNGYNTLFTWNSSGQITISSAATFNNTIQATQFNAFNDRNYLARGGFRITSATNNTSTLDISVTDSTTTIYSNYFSGGNDNTIILGTYANLSNQLVLKSSGNIGMGVTNPTNRLHVSGNIYSTDTVFARNLKPEAFAGPVAGSPTGATIPLGYSSINISTPCDGNWRSIMSNINDVKGFFWVTLGDAASKDTAHYFMAMTSPAYGVSNFGAVSYQDNGWNTGGFEFTIDSLGSGTHRLLVRCTSYYNSANTAYGTIYFLRME